MISCHHLLPLLFSCLAESVDLVENPEDSIDQVAVLTSNILFFVVMFIFAVFETYVFVQSSKAVILESNI